MPSAISNLLFVFALTFLSACGSPTTSQVELSSKLSFLAADHEVIFLGRHYLTNTKFSVIAEADGFDIDLLQGKWEFAIIAWEKNGTGRFTGTTKCGVKENVEVSGASVKLDFDISTSSCNNEYFRSPGYLSSVDGQIQELKVKDCLSLSAVTNGSSTCTSPGTFTHFRLAYIPQLKGIITSAQAPQFISNCETFSTTTNIKLPAHARVHLNLQLITYSEATCTNQVSQFNLPKGIAEHAGRTRVFDLSDATIMYLGTVLPSLVAQNTIQLSLGSTIPNGETRNASLRFIQPNHYSGSLAVSCVATPSSSISAYISTYACNCDANGDCTLSFTVDNGSGAPLNKIVFNYTLSSSGGDTSNAATAVSCSGATGSCTY